MFIDLFVFGCCQQIVGTLWVLFLEVGVQIMVHLFMVFVGVLVRIVVLLVGRSGEGRF